MDFRRSASVALALAYGTAGAWLAARYPLTRQMALLYASSLLTSVVVLLVSFRAVSMDHAVRTRLTSNLKAYRAALSRKVILSNGGYTSIVRMSLGSNLVAAAIIIWNHSSRSWFAAKVGAPAAYLVGLQSAVVCCLSIVMSLLMPVMSVDFDEPEDKPGKEGWPEEIPDALPPIKVLAPFLARNPGWHKVASTSRRHDVLVKLDKDQRSYEIKTVWAADHPSASSGTPAPCAPMKGKLDGIE